MNMISLMESNSTNLTTLNFVFLMAFLSISKLIDLLSELSLLRGTVK